MIWKTSQNSQINTRNSHLEKFCQEMFLKILQKSQIKNFAGVSFLIKLQVRNLNLSEAIKCFQKDALVFKNQPFIDSIQNRCSWIIHNIHRKKPVLESLFNILAVLRTCNFIKDTINPLQLFIFTNVICCFRLPLWVGYFIYLIFTGVTSIVYQSLHL